MKALLTIFFLFLGMSAFAQKADVEALDKVIGDFNKALTERDSTKLNTLLSDDLRYGHSNGWVENKKELVTDLYNGKLTYKTISAKEESRAIEGNTAAVRSLADIDCVMDGKPMTFKLKVLQVWIWKNKRWELFARQSAKV